MRGVTVSLIQYLHKISVLVPSLLYLVQSDYTRAGQGAQTNTIVNGLGAIFDAEIFQVTSDLLDMGECSITSRVSHSCPDSSCSLQPRYLFVSSKKTLHL